MCARLVLTDAYRRFKHGRRVGEVVFVDETWVEVAGKTWYLVVFVNEHGKVLDAVLEPSRKAAVITTHLEKILARALPGVKFLVTDDFSTYKGVAFALGRDIVHVRHVHKPPYGRVVVDVVRWEGNVAHYTTAATCNDVVTGSNAFIAMVSRRTRTRHERGKRGRKPGGKNRSRRDIEAEKRRKAGRGRKKRGPADPFKKGAPEVFQFDAREGSVTPWGRGDAEVATTFAALAKVFGNRCITTNPVEWEFSALKKLVDFRGKRTPRRLRAILELYFVTRQERDALPHLLRELDFNPGMVLANLGRLTKFKKPSYRVRR